MSLAKYKFFVGLVSIMKPSSTAPWAQMHQYNETFCGWYKSRAEALGTWIDFAVNKHESNNIVFQAAYDVTSNAENNPNEP